MIGIIGLTVRSPDGHKIGKISDIHLDEQTGDPEWMEVNVGRLHHKVTVLPIAAATRDAEGIIVPFDKKKVKAAPTVANARFITPGEETLLYTYYGVSFAKAPSDPRPLVPGRPYAPVAPPTPAGGPPGAPRKVPADRPLDAWSKEELYQRAKDLDLPGRSKMTKAQLVEALSRV
jgi:sporulation protein YlmC with PRC-barrel domain